jgi:hypothetical protein
MNSSHSTSNGLQPQQQVPDEENPIDDETVPLTGRKDANE